MIILHVIIHFTIHEIFILLSPLLHIHILRHWFHTEFGEFLFAHTVFVEPVSLFSVHQLENNRACGVQIAFILGVVWTGRAMNIFFLQLSAAWHILWVRNHK